MTTDNAAALAFSIVFIISFWIFQFAMTRTATARLGTSLHPFVGKTVDVHAWGKPIGAWRVFAIRGLGAGIMFFLEPVTGGKSTMLKIAQPRTVRHDERELVIQEARYVQWASRRVKRVEGRPALEIRVS